MPGALAAISLVVALGGLAIRRYLSVARRCCSVDFQLNEFPGPGFVGAETVPPVMSVSSIRT